MLSHFLVFSRLKLEIAQLNDVLTGLTFSCVTHVFKCNRLRLVAFFLQKEKCFLENFWWNNFGLFISDGRNKVFVCFSDVVSKAY